MKKTFTKAAAFFVTVSLIGTAISSLSSCNFRRIRYEDEPLPVEEKKLTINSVRDLVSFFDGYVNIEPGTNEEKPNYLLTKDFAVEIHYSTLTTRHTPDFLTCDTDELPRDYLFINKDQNRYTRITNAVYGMEHPSERYFKTTETHEEYFEGATLTSFLSVTQDSEYFWTYGEFEDPVRTFESKKKHVYDDKEEYRQDEIHFARYGTPKLLIEENLLFPFWTESDRIVDLSHDVNFTDTAFETKNGCTTFRVALTRDRFRSVLTGEIDLSTFRLSMTVENTYTHDEAGIVKEEYHISIETENVPNANFDTAIGFEESIDAKIHK